MEVWEPIPYGNGNAQVQARIQAMEAWSAELEEQEKELRRRSQEVQDWTANLQLRERELQCQQASFRKQWGMNQEIRLLHLVVFRLVRIQAAAAQAGQDRWAAEDGKEEVEPPHERYGGVEVLVCLRRPLTSVAGEYPLYSILRSSTPMWMSDLCKQEPGTDAGGFLRRLIGFTEAVREDTRWGKPLLYYVLTSNNVIFNELPGAPLGDLGSGTCVGACSAAAAAFIASRYEAAVNDWSPEVRSSTPAVAPVVVGVETLCRDLRDQPCSDLAKRPFLSAMGMVGPAKALEALARAMLKEAGDGPIADATPLLRRVAEQRPDLVVPDVHSHLFGSLAEASAGPCSESQTGSEGFTNSYCGASEPCCPISNQLEQLYEAFNKRLTVSGCVVQRGNETPVSWHGDGLAKWPFLLALDKLSGTCRYMARLVLAHIPGETLDSLFKMFEAIQAPGATQGSR